MTSWFKLSHHGIFMGHRYFCKIKESGPWRHDSNYHITEYSWAIDIFVRLKSRAMTSWFKLSHIGIFMGHRYFCKIKESGPWRHDSNYHISEYSWAIDIFVRLKSRGHDVMIQFSYLGIFMGHDVMIQIITSRSKSLAHNVTSVPVNFWNKCLTR
jgi:hypothetical protein